MLTSQHIELEQSILGTLFLNSNLLVKAKDNIKPYMFQVENHKRIYEGIIKMVSDDKEIDLINFLENYKEIVKEMGGVSYVSEVFSCSSTELAFETKLELLIKAYQKRLVLDLCTYISDDMTIEHMENKIKNTLDKIYSCTLKKDLNIEDIYDDYLLELYNDESELGAKSGLTKIDEALGNFRKGRLITVFARSGVGKSIFSTQLAKDMAFRGHKVIYGTSEMTRNEIIDRMAANHLHISCDKFNNKRLTNEEKDKVSAFCGELLNNQLYISNETDIDKLINEIKVYKLRNNLDIVFIDYINKYVNVESNVRLTELLGKITSKCKTLATEEDICVVLIAQANRNVDKNIGEVYEVITEADIQDSARIEQDSDQIIGLYRQKLFDEKIFREKMYRDGKLKYDSKDAKENPNCINISILKNRHGTRGIKAFRWEGEYCKISNW
ncbi:Replicative DNA helicase [uncultured Clostridium sp.]|uniref:replicative DNA helicase n=1 Tax=uncultured Clostridium sp. TaxID=59620 RepID=UPI000822F8E8|nr:DnaB-like helicase C-terminal domain-containing protein [uncultured Clostridium sp.]SCJ37571.1 Replicative DNA helicase [uncultured Clostridium sp.]